MAKQTQKPKKPTEKKAVEKPKNEPVKQTEQTKDVKKPVKRIDFVKKYRK